MASTFASLSLFNSGPHRFILGKLGRYTRGPFQTPAELPFTSNDALRELSIIQSGRLIAATNAELWTLIDAVQLRAEQGLVGTLVDHQGKQWTNLTLHNFQPERRIDRGRSFSVRYRCDYLRFGG